MTFTFGSASAPGKAILFGEHAVVSGATAVATSLSDLRVEAHASPIEGTGIVHIVLEFLEGSEYSSSCKWTIEQFHDALRKGGALSWMPDPLKAEPPPDGLVDALEELCGCKDTPQHRAFVPALFLAAALLPDLSPNPSTLPKVPTGLKLVCPNSNIPVGAGLGSSAAYSVAVAGALVSARLGLQRCVARGQRKASRTTLNPVADVRSAINEWAFQSECIIHGKPSGIDNTVSAFGGTVKYRKLSVGPSIEFFAGHGAPKLSLLIANTNVPRETRALVAKVQASLHSSDPAESRRMRGIFSAVDAVSKNYVRALEDSAWAAQLAGSSEGSPAERLASQMGALMDTNQQLLIKMGVSHPSIERVCKFLSEKGLHSKLTGAGGGGCVIALLPPGSDGSALAQQLESELGCATLRSNLGGSGVYFIAPMTGE